MLQERPATPILAPVETGIQTGSETGTVPGGESSALLNERVVRLAQDKDGWWFLRFENDNTPAPTVRVLPNSNLAKARALSKSKTGVEIRIVVWGEVMPYKDSRYILLRRVVKHQPMSRF